MFSWMKRNRKKPHEKKMEHLHQAIEKAKKGESFLSDLRESKYQSLLEIKAQAHLGISRVRIEGADNACPQCMSVRGKVLSLQKELENQTLPHQDCTYQYQGLCRCYYEVVFDDE